RLPARAAIFRVEVRVPAEPDLVLPADAPVAGVAGGLDQRLPALQTAEEGAHVVRRDRVADLQIDAVDSRHDLRLTGAGGAERLLPVLHVKRVEIAPRERLERVVVGPGR